MMKPSPDDVADRFGRTPLIHSSTLNMPALDGGTGFDSSDHELVQAAYIVSVHLYPEIRIENRNLHCIEILDSNRSRAASKR